MVFATRERDAMQTFRISKVQRSKSGRPIRIFGIVHLVAAVGLVVLLDGPGMGCGGYRGP